MDIFEKFNYSTQNLLHVLKEMESHLPEPRVRQIENLERSIKDVRTDLLNMELKEKYPGADPDAELIDLVGSEPVISLKEEKEEIRKMLEKRI